MDCPNVEFVFCGADRRKDSIEIGKINIEGECRVLMLQLGIPHMATTMILDDNHGGVFQFESTSHSLFTKLKDAAVIVV